MNNKAELDLNRCFQLARDAAWYWVGALENAGIKENINAGIRILENWQKDKTEKKELKLSAENCYRSISNSSLPLGGPERSAGRSVAHGLFALYFYKQGQTDKLRSSLRNCLCNAERALREHPQLKQ